MIDATMLIRAWVENSTFGDCEHAKEANLLIVDDIGVREMTEAQRTAFLEIVNMRGNRPTIYTGNHPVDTISAALGDDRLARRIIGGTRWNFLERLWTQHAKTIEF